MHQEGIVCVSVGKANACKRVAKIISVIRGSVNLRRHRVFCLNDYHDLIDVSPRIGVEISPITFGNVQRVAEFRGLRHVRFFQEYLKQGQHGVYARVGPKVVGHAWAKVCTDSRCRVNRYMDISCGEALIHACQVHQPHRGNNIYPVMLVALCRRLFSEGRVHRILIDTETHNYASLRGIAKVGFKPLGTGYYLQFMGRLLFQHFADWGGEVWWDHKPDRTRGISQAHR